MRQRIKLAQALVHDPQVLFLDEPLTGTDPVSTRETVGTDTPATRATSAMTGRRSTGLFTGRPYFRLCEAPDHDAHHPDDHGPARRSGMTERSSSAFAPL